MEVFSALGLPARMFGRLPLITRYLWIFSGGQYSHRYAEARFGKSWIWRPWLRVDVAELQMLEELINTGSDEKIRGFRDQQLESLRIVSLVVCGCRS